MGGVGGEEGVPLEATATWAMAVVCFFLVAISILIDQLFFHLIHIWLKKKRKSYLSEAHAKIKTELMLLGFMSLLLTALQRHLSQICIPTSVARSWHPCTNHNRSNHQKYDDPCQPKRKVQFVSPHGTNQLHRFIFALAVTHVICCVTTLGLSRLKINRWKSWEDETKTVEYQCYNDPERFRLLRETTFGRRHLHFWSKSPLLLWIVCLLSQFFTSVAKVDYLTLRHGFIQAHLSSQSQATFNFQRYVIRALEDDFKIIVGISPIIWLSALLFLLTNTNGWHSHLWLPFIPLTIILLIGAKFQVIITTMGIHVLERGDVISGTPLVKLGDNLFWFSRPRFILFLIHFVLFQNAFQIAFFAWSWYEFGYPSCYHENLTEIIIRISTGVFVQVVCSYVTLPLYALVTQMGSSIKPIIFSELVASALRTWYLTSSERLKQRRQLVSTTPARGGGGAIPTHRLRGHRKHIEINKGRIGGGGGGGGGGGEGTSASSSHYEINDKMRNSRSAGEIEQVDDDNKTNQAQLEVETSSRDFSFGNKRTELSLRVS